MFRPNRLMYFSYLLFFNVCVRACVRVCVSNSKLLVKKNPLGIRYFTCWSEHMKRSDKPLLKKETIRKLQLLPGIEPHPQRWESTTLTTAPIPLTFIVLLTVHHLKVHFERGWLIRCSHFLFYWENFIGQLPSWILPYIAVELLFGIHFWPMFKPTQSFWMIEGLTYKICGWKIAW